MKTFATLALAGAIAATSLATTATTADAGGKHWKQNKYNNYHHGKNYSKGWNPGGALAAGALLGFAFGALATPNYYYAPPPRVYYPPPPPPAYPAYPAYGYAVGPQASSRHVDWCYSRYKSYNVQRNSWVGYDGYVHQCISPFPY